MPNIERSLSITVYRFVLVRYRYLKGCPQLNLLYYCEAINMLSCKACKDNTYAGKACLALLIIILYKHLISNRNMAL